MSKVVKSVGRAISKVVKGAVNVVKGAVNGVSKIFGDSKFGKILLTSAAVYFGGAALMGGFGASAAGGSFLSGMGAGISSAASGISSAWTAITSGQGLGAAGSSLGEGFMGANAAGAATVAPAAQFTGQTATGLATLPGDSANVLNAATQAGTKAAGSGIFSSPYTAPALISGGTAIIGGVMQGKAMEDQRNFELEQQRLARERYGTNVGTSLWGAAPTESAPASGPTAYQSIGYDQRLSAATPAASNMQQIDPATGQPMSVADLNRRSATAFNQIWQRPGLVGNYAYMNPSIYGG